MGLGLQGLNIKCFQQNNLYIKVDHDCDFLTWSRPKHIGCMNNFIAAEVWLAIVSRTAIINLLFDIGGRI